MDIIFKEKVERDGKSKKKAKKKAKTKKGKKAKRAGDEEEQKEEIPSKLMKENWIDKELKKTFNTTDATVEVHRDPFT